MVIRKGTCFKGQEGNIVYLGRILDVFDKAFVCLDVLQVGPGRVAYKSIAWPYKSLASMKNVQLITEEQYTCMRSVLG